MAASAVQNPPVQTEAKSGKKKKAKAERTRSPAPASTATPEKAASVTANDNQEETSDNPYIRELQKGIRNVNKKISNSAKIENIIADHPGKSLDELVSLKLINADQKASHLKKPALREQLAQLEEQLATHKKIDAESRARLAEHEKTLTAKFEKEKAELVAELEKKAADQANTMLKDNLLVLSQFLRLAAARRTEDADSTSDESQALEGVLLHIYSGDEDAVATMLKLVQGVEEQTRSTTGELLATTYAQVKQASVAYVALNLYSTDEAPETTESEAVESEEQPQTDPTVANAGLTEIDDGSAVQLTNGHTPEEQSPVDGAPANADVNDSAANAAGESQYDAGANDMSTSQEWVDVKVPRDPSETETGVIATPAAPSNTNSWADETAAETPAGGAAPADPNDGFHQVQRNRGTREGGYRGRGGDRGGYRGRGGFRGDGRGRGRGRGGPRGGGPRGGRGGDNHAQPQAQ
ncbi:hypothetical protein QBC46DRAFT_381810 [Diplogelasinospora grovesii]|uniref:YAG7-like dimerisation domain-containing protein n=1 Tax=Diplogelasinospora grovesii TaxID=303347 RepID=A0AAN6NAA7_9PEZI|nr:hypothetical protein QBC46DRAFT_381810 [Diplogelasinospora grovesii]